MKSASGLLQNEALRGRPFVQSSGTKYVVYKEFGVTYEFIRGKMTHHVFYDADIVQLKCSNGPAIFVNPDDAVIKRDEEIPDLYWSFFMRLGSVNDLRAVISRVEFKALGAGRLEARKQIRDALGLIDSEGRSLEVEEY